MKVRHSAEELNEGETMILTLADRGILDDTGNLVEDNDELENALVVRAQQPCMHVLMPCLLVMSHMKTPSMDKCRS